MSKKTGKQKTSQGGKPATRPVDVPERFTIEAMPHDFQMKVSDGETGRSVQIPASSKRGVAIVLATFFGGGTPASAEAAADVKSVAKADPKAKSAAKSTGKVAAKGSAKASPKSVSKSQAAETASKSSPKSAKGAVGTESASVNSGGQGEPQGEANGNGSGASAKAAASQRTKRATRARDVSKGTPARSRRAASGAVGNGTADLAQPDTSSAQTLKAKSPAKTAPKAKSAKARSAKSSKAPSTAADKGADKAAGGKVDLAAAKAAVGRARQAAGSRAARGRAAAGVAPDADWTSSLPKVERSEKGIVLKRTVIAVDPGKPDRILGDVQKYPGGRQAVAFDIRIGRKHYGYVLAQGPAKFVVIAPDILPGKTVHRGLNAAMLRLEVAHDYTQGKNG